MSGLPPLDPETGRRWIHGVALVLQELLVHARLQTALLQQLVEQGETPSKQREAVRVKSRKVIREAAEQEVGRTVFDAFGEFFGRRS